MKKTFIVFAVALLLGCAGNGIEYTAPELPADLCMEYPVGKSLIRRVATEHGIPLNDLYYGLIDATAIAMLSDAVDRDAVRVYLLDLQAHRQRTSRESYTNLIRYMLLKDRWKDWQLIEGILLRRIQIFNSSMWISQHDSCLIDAGIEGALNDLGM